MIPSDSLIQRIKGRGPVLVSSDNPYLAANLLLQQEAKKSKELAGFLTKMGQPQAISVEQKLMQTAKVEMYYKQDMQQYNMELLRGIWVIDGPYKISDSNVINLVNMQSSSALIKPSAASTYTDEAVSDEELQMASVNNDSSLKAATNENLNKEQHTDGAEQAVKNYALDSKQNQESEIISSSEKEDFDLNTNDGSDLEPLFDKQKNTTVDQGQKLAVENTLNSQASKALAETTPRGDIVHYVSYELETLDLIARWYTGTNLTLSRIAKANNLATDAVISVGDQIIIPKEFIKNKFIPTEIELAELIS